MWEMLQVLVVVIGVMPVSVALHEFGHAIPQLIAGDSVKVVLGIRAKKQLNFSVHRLSVTSSIYPISGCVIYQGRERVLSAIGGPLVSLLIVVLSVIGLDASRDFVQSVSISVLVCNSNLFLWTSIPMKYPSWMGVYSGFRSDGLRIFDILRRCLARNVQGSLNHRSESANKPE